MPIQRIIIIFSQNAAAASSGIGLLVFAAAGILLFGFFKEGDDELGTINTISSRTACFPTIGHYNSALKAASLQGLKDTDTQPARIEILYKNWNAIWLKKGTEVKVLQTPAPRGLEYNPHYWFQARRGRLIELLDNSKRLCIAEASRLDMGFFEWINWKWKWDSKPYVAADEVNTKIIENHRVQSMIIQGFVAREIANDAPRGKATRFVGVPHSVVGWVEYENGKINEDTITFVLRSMGHPVNSCNPFVLRFERGNSWCKFNGLQQGNYQIVAAINGVSVGKWDFDVVKP
ncbi:hypothetical protein HUU62_04840 [Rhodoferax sp. 4810]|nr:hypothetical protein [Rhodoferax jenense]